MKILNVEVLDHQAINDSLRDVQEDCTLINCCGQRFIAAGMSDKNITISGVPGNALGAYLNGASITVNANAQDFHIIPRLPVFFYDFLRRRRLTPVLSSRFQSLSCATVSVPESKRCKYRRALSAQLG